jgi:sugar/nucleoside kinase (ribokinase family)
VEARWDVLGFGIVAVDDLLYVDRYPPPDTKVPVRESQRQGGGLTGTALVAAARLGAKTAYAGVLGSDELSSYTIGELQREGVDCTHVLHHPDARPVHAVIIVDTSTGQRTILYSAEGLAYREPQDIREELIGACRVLFIDQSTRDGGLHAVRLARARGIPVVADLEKDLTTEVQQFLQEVDHVIVGVDLAGRATGEPDPERMARALRSSVHECRVVTAGEQGCWYSERGGAVHHVPAYRVPVVDTTGCGDVFHGAYAACIARGESVAVAVQVATAAAALKATQPGGRAGIPGRQAVDQFLLAQRS